MQYGSLREELSAAEKAAGVRRHFEVSLKSMVEKVRATTTVTTAAAKMMRWTVDIAGIDLEEDLQREEQKKVHTGPVTSTRDQWRTDDSLHISSQEKRDELGDVWVLDAQEVYDLHEERIVFAAPIISTATQLQPQFTTAAFPTLATATLSNSELLNSACLTKSHSTASELSVASTKGKELRIFSTFLNPQGKLTAMTVTMQQPQYRGIDIVSNFLQQAMQAENDLSERYSSNARLYKLFIADEFTGEDEMSMQLDRETQNFTCYAVHPLPAAKLFLFPQRTELRPTVHGDVSLVVHIKPLEAQTKPAQRVCAVPPDLLAESLEGVLTRQLLVSEIVPGSLRICYGPLELNINEFYNFGAGCGQMNCPIAEYTMLTLYRFGVSEVMVSGHGVEDQPENPLPNPTEDIEISMDMEEAMSFQQFEVIRINRYGARQQRVLCVDGEHLYTMRPNSEEVPKTTERMVKDIEDVRLFPNRPKYMEIVYTKASRFEEDHIECPTAYNCALLDEKLRLVRRELRKRAESSEVGEQQNTLQRVLVGLRQKWFGT